MSDQSEMVPEILYHYTAIDSLVKIVESRKIRATRYDQMNDISEVQLGVEKLLEAVKSHEIDVSLTGYKDFLVSGIETYKEDTLDVFVLSFSGIGDSLDQWRAYASNGGVAIGFDYGLVQKGFLCDITPHVGGYKVDNPIRPSLGNRLMRCEYTDKDGDVDLRSIVAKRFFQPNSYGAMFVAQEPGIHRIFDASLSAMIYRTICSIKHGAYKSEVEWRCVNYRPDATDYPINRSNPNKWFIELMFDPKEFIKRVLISPHGDTAAYEHALIQCKKKYDLRFAIEKSNIPFRI